MRAMTAVMPRASAVTSAATRKAFWTRARLPPPPVVTRPLVKSTTRVASSSDGSSSTDATGPWNTAPLAMTDDLYAYLLRNTRECGVLRALREETSALRGARMQVAPEQGSLLGMMVELTDARRVVEIGTYTGYSSIAMALAMREGGKLYACDRSEESMEVARRYWKEAGVEGKIEERVGDARVTVLDLLHEFGENSFDLGFIDADKRAYKEYYEGLLKLVRPGGLIIVDNVLWYGKVADPEVQDKQTDAIREFNEFVTNDERVTYTMVPVGDGLSFCRKR